MMNERFMLDALKQAKIAYAKDEVPIGAVVVLNGEIIGRGYNKRQHTKNALDHAEMIAIKKACARVGDWRLEDCDIYVTLEPCPMCAGAIVNARIKNLYYGASDKNSTSDLLSQILNDDRLNHKTNVKSGVLESQCSQLLTEFFAQKRKKL